MACGVIVRIGGGDGAAVDTVAGINAVAATAAMMSANSLDISAPDGTVPHSKYTTNSDRTEHHQQSVRTHNTQRSDPCRARSADLCALPRLDQPERGIDGTRSLSERV
jgi:hypothetical protein